mgnify:CR=1 FL=1
MSTANEFFSCTHYERADNFGFYADPRCLYFDARTCILSSARNAAGQMGRPIQLMGFGDAGIAAGADEVLTTSAPGIPDSGGKF